MRKKTSLNIFGIRELNEFEILGERNFYEMNRIVCACICLNYNKRNRKMTEKEASAGIATICVQ